MSMKLLSKRLRVTDSIDAIYETYYTKGWTDGLPIIPPTEDRVEAMLGGTDHSPDHVVATIPPADTEATVEKIAINAVMAGCRPEYMPVLVASVQAMSQKQFNLTGVQTTTAGLAPLLVVNGPITRQLDINGGTACFGPGYRANATIGRAIRLILINIGGARPGEGTMGTFGTPGRYTYCVSENEEASPWEPLHVERGFSRDTSTATVIANAGFIGFSDLSSKDGRNMIKSMAEILCNPGNDGFCSTGPDRDYESLLLFSPERARILADSGFTKRDIQEALFNMVRIRWGDVVGRNYWGNRTLARWIDEEDPDMLVPMVRKPENIVILVVGGPAGKQWAWAKTFSTSHSATVKIEQPGS